MKHVLFGILFFLCLGPAFAADRLIHFDVLLKLGACEDTIYEQECGALPDYASGSAEIIFDDEDLISGFGEGTLSIGSATFSNPRINAGGGIAFSGAEGVLVLARKNAKPGSFKTSIEGVDQQGHSIGGAAYLGTQRLDFAQFADGQGLFSQITLLNLDNGSATHAFAFFLDDTGNALSVDDGEGAIELEIPPSGMRRLETDGAGPLQAGGATILSDKPLAGVLLFGGTAGLTGVGPSAVLQHGFAAPMDRHIGLPAESVNTGIALINLDPQTRVLSLTLKDMDGNLIATTSSSLTGMGHLARFIDEIEGWEPEVDFSHFNGILTVTFEGRVAATVIQSRPGQFATLPVAPIATD